MSIDSASIHKIAKLAALSLSAEEEKLYANDLEKILNYVDQLNTVDTGASQAPTIFMDVCSLREDEPVALSQEETQAIVSCSKQTLHNQFHVPPILDGEQ